MKSNDIEIDIVREKRASLSLTYLHGRFVVKAPHHLDEVTIADFIRNHQGWIRQKQRKLSERSSHAIFGKAIDWEQHGSPKTLAEKNRIHKAQCCAKLKNLYDLTCAKHTARPPPLKIRTMASAWGKCFSTNRIELHWKVARLPPDLAEYVICHELAHLVHFDHSTKFWALADELCPGARKKDRELGRHSLDD